MLAMPADASIEFPDVELIHEAPAALCFRINGQEVWVPRPGILSAWGLVKRGDRGTLVLVRWAAERLGLA
jgi:hypothetical protein